MIELNYEPIPVVDISTISREEWLNYRKSGFGGSDAPIIFGESEWNTKLDLYHQKIDSPALVEDEFDENKEFRFSFGHHMEDFVAMWFPVIFEKKYQMEFSMIMGKKITGVEMVKDSNMYRHPLFSFMLVDLDYVIIFSFADGTQKKGVFECKTTSPYSIKNAWKEDVPYIYQLQDRHAMAVMNYDFAVTACASDNSASNYYAHLILRDTNKEEMIINGEKELWEENILKRKPPEISTVAADTYFKTILKYEAGPVDKLAEETPLKPCTRALKSYFKVAGKIQKHKDAVKLLEKDMEVETARVFKAMGTNSICIGNDDDFIYHVKKIEKISTSFNKAALAKVMPDIVEQYTNEKAKIEIDIKKEKKQAFPLGETA